MENLLYLLPLLACPVMMGAMMWMMRGNQNQATGSSETPSANLAATANPDDRLAVLRTQLTDMERQQATITGQIAQLQDEDRPAAMLGSVETESTGPHGVSARGSA